MKRYIPLLFAALALVSCHNGIYTGIYTDDIAMPAYEGSADSLLMSISLEFLRSGDIKDAVNNAVVSRAFDYGDNWTGSLEESAPQYRENLIDEYLTENSGESTSTWEDRLNGNFSGQYRDWINYVLSYYSYRGGAHGIQTVSPIVFDAKTGAIVSEQDLFAPGYEQPVAELLKEAVKVSMEAEDAELLGLVDMELVAPNNNFSVSSNGVEWVFQPYEVGPYALGIVSASLDWKQLKPYLK
ncbi:MAG: DUF3298 domain-containing protein [Bacteroidales bacterium]|nr:DUF3298 domain-containing protein [Bacteroidales bacterium]